MYLLYYFLLSQQNPLFTSTCCICQKQLMKPKSKIPYKESKEVESNRANIGVVEFFKLTMLPYSVSTSLSKKQTPCVVSIHNYTSAQKLLDILIECGGENDKFKLFPPDTFKDFYKLHQRFWDPALRKIEIKNKTDFKTTLEDDELQAVILKPYENTISTLFEKYRTMPKIKGMGENCPLRKAGDDFMKETLKIDVAHSKSVVPVERMQLLLKYMEQLQEYGSRVLVSGRPEMIQIYHNAIDNLRKDLDECRKDIEKNQKETILNANTVQVNEICASRASNSSSQLSSRRRVSPKRGSKSPWRKSRCLSPRKRSASPKHSRSLRSSSPRRRPRSKLPRRNPIQTSSHTTSHRKAPSSFTEEFPSQRQNYSLGSLQSADHRPFSSSFEDQFRKYIENLRRFRVEIENTPLERRSNLKNKLAMFKDQLSKFRAEVSDNPGTLGYIDEMEICKEEIFEQTDMLARADSYNHFSESNTIAPWKNVRSFDSSNLSVSYPLPESRLSYGSQVPSSTMYRQDKPLGFRFPY